MSNHVPGVTLESNSPPLNQANACLNCTTRWLSSHTSRARLEPEQSHHMPDRSCRIKEDCVIARWGCAQRPGNPTGDHPRSRRIRGSTRTGTRLLRAGTLNFRVHLKKVRKDRKCNRRTVHQTIEAGRNKHRTSGRTRGSPSRRPRRSRRRRRGTFPTSRPGSRRRRITSRRRRWPAPRRRRSGSSGARTVRRRRRRSPRPLACSK